VDGGFGPLKGCGGLVIGDYKLVDGLTHLLRGGEAGPLQCAALKNAEPALDLIEP
jgi:hypothetical protein